MRRMRPARRGSGRCAGRQPDRDLLPGGEGVGGFEPTGDHQSTDGWQRVEATPQPSSGAGCRQVCERVYQDNQLVREQIREVC